LGSAAPRWVEHGYLVFFEGLISTQGKEFGMIQDTDAVVEIMRSWKVKLGITTTKNAASSAAAAAASGGGSNMNRDQLDMETDLETQTVTLKLSAEIYTKLPPCLQGGATIPLFPILFTQV
jgi:uncharacterized protein with beta-barrel porin domain